MYIVIDFCWLCDLLRCAFYRLRDVICSAPWLRGSKDAIDVDCNGSMTWEELPESRLLTVD